MLAARSFRQLAPLARPLSTASITPSIRAAQRAARRLAADTALTSKATSTSGSGGASINSTQRNTIITVATGMLVGLVTWTVGDPESPPNQLMEIVGLK